jgi:hypothetical protein
MGKIVCWAGESTLCFSCWTGECRDNARCGEDDEGEEFELGHFEYIGAFVLWEEK